MTDYCITGIYGLATDIGRFQPDFILSIRESRPTDADTAQIETALRSRARGVPVVTHRYDDVTAVTDRVTAPSAAPFHGLAQALTALPAQPERILVHCHAGISRSSAATLFLMAWDACVNRKLAAGPDLAASLVDDLYLVSHNIMPNLRIVRIAEAVLSHHGVDFDRSLLAATQSRLEAERRSRAPTKGMQW